MTKNSKDSQLLRIIGFCLIIIGVGCLLFYLLIGRFIRLSISPQDMAVIFFIMMLGMAFIFPQLLEDRNKGLSTMRIVVFMMVNLICLLLLKLGWDQPTLKSIGVDQWWMGIIAFVFGAKATQAYFESNLAKIPPSLPTSTAVTGAPTDQLIQMAIDQNRSTFNKPNITAVMAGKMFKQGQLEDCITVHLSDTQMTGYPTSVTVRPAQGDPSTVDVDYITDVATPKALNVIFTDGTNVSNVAHAGSTGTICCKLNNPSKNENYALTCNHVMNAGSGFNNAGPIDPPQGVQPAGSWVWGMRTDDLDAALIKIDSTITFAYNIPSLKGKQPRTLTGSDMMTTDVTMAGNSGSGRPRLVTGKITNYSSLLPIDVGYTDGSQPLNNLIVLSQVTSNGNSTTYVTLSGSGDSGALIYDQNNNPIAMVVAGNLQFTYAIPLSTILLNTQTIIA